MTSINFKSKQLQNIRVASDGYICAHLDSKKVGAKIKVTNLDSLHIGGNGR